MNSFHLDIAGHDVSSVQCHENDANEEHLSLSRQRFDNTFFVAA